jgi:hypothetical protein
MKLQLEVTYVDTSTNCIVFKPKHCGGLQGDIVYKDLPRRAVEQFKIGQTVEATIPLPDHYPVDENQRPYPCYDPSAFETKQMDGKWYKHSKDYPHNWEPIQREIEKAIQASRCDGQPHVIPGCGYVSNYGEFIPYKRVVEYAA